jgi:hypothetical protein
VLMGVCEQQQISPGSSGSRTRTGFGPASNQPMSPGSRSVPRSDQAPSRHSPTSQWAAAMSRLKCWLPDPKGARIVDVTAPRLGEPREHETTTDRTGYVSFAH